MLKRSTLSGLLVLALMTLAAVGTSQQDSPASLGEEHRQFVHDGPGWLLDEETIDKFLRLDLVICRQRNNRLSERLINAAHQRSGITKRPRQLDYFDR